MSTIGLGEEVVNTVWLQEVEGKKKQGLSIALSKLLEIEKSISNKVKERNTKNGKFSEQQEQFFEENLKLLIELFRTTAQKLLGDENLTPLKDRKVAFEKYNQAREAILNKLEMDLEITKEDPSVKQFKEIGGEIFKEEEPSDPQIYKEINTIKTRILKQRDEMETHFIVNEKKTFIWSTDDRTKFNFLDLIKEEYEALEGSDYIKELKKRYDVVEDIEHTDSWNLMTTSNFHSSNISGAFSREEINPVEINGQNFNLGVIAAIEYEVKLALQYKELNETLKKYGL